MMAKKGARGRQGRAISRVEFFRTPEGEDLAVMPRAKFELLDANLRLFERIMAERPQEGDRLKWAMKLLENVDFDSIEEVRDVPPSLPIEDLEDQDAFDAAEAESSEPVPHAVFSRILAGENPIKVYRKWRGLTQSELAAEVAIVPKYLSQIETGRRNASLGLTRRLAAALHADLEDLLD